MTRRKGLPVAALTVAAIAFATGASTLWVGLSQQLVDILGRPPVRAQLQPSTKIGGPFTLVDDTGATVTEKTLAGKPYAMYFGYTFCPDVCPTTLLDLSRWIQKLGSDADKLNYVFVTVDPERDTVQSMHAYLSSFDKHIRGYTGTPAEIAKIAKEYRIYYKKVPTDDGSYTMDHSALIFLMGPDGKGVSVIPYQEDDASAIGKLKNLAALTSAS
jgi:protein SCO1